MGPVSIYGLTLQALRFLAIAELALVLVPGGSAAAAPAHVIGFLIFTTTALAGVSARWDGAAGKFATLAFGIAAIIAIWAVFQTQAFESNIFANALWHSPELNGPNGAASISIEPADTWQALIKVIMPFAVFITCILLFDSDERALRLLSAIAIIGTITAAVGIIQFRFFPDRLFFSMKTAYADSLTGAFVNHNTAATHFAATLVICAAFFFHRIQSYKVSDFVRKIAGQAGRLTSIDFLRILFWAFCALVTLTALLLTRSRAGVGSGLFGLLIFSMIAAYFGGYSSKRKRGRGFAARSGSSRWAPLLRIGSVLLISLILVMLFTGQVGYRQALSGGEDLRFCVYPDIIRAIFDYWVTGTGLGTFQDAFSPYRNPACSLYGIWEMGHNFYLEAWLTLGVPFIVAAGVVLSVLTVVFIRGISARRKFRWVPAAGFSILILTVVHSAIDFSLQIPGYAVIFAALMAGTVSVAFRDPRKNGSNKPSATRAAD